MDAHQINNLLGIIRIQCESFVMDTEQGLFKDKSLEEQNAMAMDIMKNVIVKVDKITDHVARVHHAQSRPLV